jgi:arginase family enzyme
MIIVKIPGINGLNRTKGCELTPDVLEKKYNRKFLSIILDNSNIENSQKNIFQESKKLFNRSTKYLFIGGDHSISFPISKSFFSKYKNSCLVCFDSHGDAMPSLKEPTHEEWLGALLNYKPIPVFLIGVKQLFEQEKHILNKKKVNITYFKDFSKQENSLINQISRFKEVYISLDLDVFSNKDFKSLAYPQKRGLNLDRIIKFIKKINPRAIDIVEFNIKKDKKNKEINKLLKIVKCVVS